MSPDLEPDAASIARRQFSSARRGLDADEVRAYLRELSDVVDGLQRRSKELLTRAEAAESRVAKVENLDEGRFVELLGEETARILDAGRAAAADIRRKAEESAARLISEANDQAHEIKAKAESDLTQRRVEVMTELGSLRAEASAELDRRRAEGAELVNDIRRSAQAEADELVDEAQVVRERMLGDLARRRRAAREQLERLNAARERLLAAYDVVRRTVDEATGELTVALPEAKLAGDAAARRIDDEPEPTVEELEGLVTMARIAGLLDPSQLEPEPDDEVEEPPAPVARVEPAPVARVEPAPVARVEPPAPPPVAPVARVEPTLPPVASVARVEPAPAPPAPEPVEPAAEPAAEADQDTYGDDSYDDDYEEWTDEDVDESDEPAYVDVAQPAAASNVDALFARLKADVDATGDSYGDADETAGHNGTVAVLADETYDDGYDDYDPSGAEGHDGEQDHADDRLAVRHIAEVPAADDDESEPEDHHDDLGDQHLDLDDLGLDDHGHDDESDLAGTPVAGDADLVRQRDTTLATVEHDLNRRLKRVLADEQNEVLDLLRRTKPASSDDLLPALGSHSARYTEAAREELGAAAAWGAAAVGGEPDGSCDALAVELGQTVVEPLRDRIAHSFVDAGGDLEEVTGRLRSLYREWKGQRIAAAVRHYAVAAYAQGAYGAVPDGTPLRWLVDRSSDPCPDADDNALAGAVCKGEAFPTGDHCPPAHLGCRCMVVPAE